MANAEILSKALEAIDSLQQRLTIAQAGSNQPVAVISAACRYPGGVRDLESYWDLLKQGRSVCEPVPEGRWINSGHYDPNADVPGKMNSVHAGWMDGVFEFDADFFHISDREAACIDPQQRLLLQIAWEAVEAAGVAPESLRDSKTGVFVGVMNNDYGNSCFTNLENIDAYYFTGNSHSFVGGRISYALGLRGPCVTLDSACASSLVSVHLACQALRRGECTLALAGGVSLILGPQLGVVLAKARVLAPDGKSKAFDAGANGMGRGEGAGLVLLKRLSDAQRDGDPILAVIRGSAVNHTGASPGITVPNVPAQQELLRSALLDAGVSAEDVDYVEAHGTGTALGDPIEASALGSVLGGDRRGRPLWIGSAKSNIGHLDSAAGMAGLMKVLAAMRHGKLPPQPGLSELNPNIEWDRWNLRVPGELMSWPSHTDRKLAGVNSFGMSGVNAHVILESPESRSPAENVEGAPVVGPYLLTVSAKTSNATTELARRYLERMRGLDAQQLAKFCRTAAVGRAAKPTRLSAAGAGPAELLQQLERRLQLEPTRVTSAPPVTFVFSGQGCQWAGMGRALLAASPAFRREIERCAEYLDPVLGRSVIALIREADDVALGRTLLAQPAVFALQVGLLALWKSWGVVPTQVVGHSLGEVAAALASGAIDLESACRIVLSRAARMDSSTGHGRMALIRGPLHVVQAVIDGLDVDIAAQNSIDATVVSGSKSGIAAAVERAVSQGCTVRELGVDYAFHSRQMQGNAEALRDDLRWLQPVPSHTPMISTVTGERVDGLSLDASYWARNMREQVRFRDATHAAAEAAPGGVFVEIGPHPVLTLDLAENLRGGDSSIVSSMRRGADEQHTLLTALGTLFEKGAPITFEHVFEQGGVMELPAYPWQAKTYLQPFDVSASAAAPLVGESSVAGLLGERVSLAVQGSVLTYAATHSCGRFPWFRDHRINGQLFVPGTALLEMMTAAALKGHDAVELLNIDFREALVMADPGVRAVQTTLDRETGDLTVWSRVASGRGDWVRHATAVVRLPTVSYDQSYSAVLQLRGSALAEARERCTRQRTGAQHLAAMAQLGLAYGPAFSGVAEVWAGEGEAVARVTEMLPGDQETGRPHPAVVDACLQVLVAALPELGESTLLPHRMRRFVWRAASKLAWCHAQIHTASEESARGDIVLYDDAGNVVAEAHDVELRATQQAQASARLLIDAWVQVETAGKTLPPSGFRWLIVADEHPDVERIAEHLREQGARVSQVSCLNAATAGDDPAPDAVLFAADLTGIDPDEGLSRLLKSVQTSRSNGSLQKFVVMTRGVLALGGEGRNWRGAGLHGFARVLEHERADWSVVSIDLDTEIAIADQLALVRPALLPGFTESFAVVRRGRLWTNRLRAPGGHDGLVPKVKAGLLLPKDGVIVITGGRGGIGLSAADFLVDRGATKLALLGRHAPSVEVRDAVQKLRLKGATIELPEVDVSDASAVHGLFRSLAHGMGKVVGIVHAAGVLDDDLIESLNDARFARALSPKVLGLQSLLDAASELQFLWLFSSVTSLLGNLGQSNYAAANAVLDAAAHHLAARGVQVRSINWGAWKEVGMLAEDPKVAASLARRGVAGMSNAEAWACFEAALNTELPQVGVLKLDPSKYALAHPGRAKSPRFSELLAEHGAQAAQTGALLVELESLPRERQVARVRAHVAQVIGEVLRRRDAIPANATFEHLGIDSLTAVEIKNRLESALTFSLSVGTLWAHPSVDALGSHLVEELFPAAAAAPTPLAAETSAGVTALLSRLRDA